MASYLQRKVLTQEERSRLTAMGADDFHAFHPAYSSVEEWSASLSALANSNGGELYLGLAPLSAGGMKFAPFSIPEDAESLLPIIKELLPLSHLYCLTLHELEEGGSVLQITICRTAGLLCAVDGTAYIRSGGKNTACNNPEKLRSLRWAKGLCSYEDELTEYILEDLLHQETFRRAMADAGACGSAYEFLRSRFLINAYNQLRVAAILLYADRPQAMLPHRCGIRILRYCSDERKDQRDDFPEEQSISIEGPLSQLVSNTLSAIAEILDRTEVVDSHGIRPTTYPVEALGELISNAVLHRDYSIPRDIQIRIFTNRIEIESPGAFLSKPDPSTRITEQRVRNPKIMRLLVEQIPSPSRDLGKGLRRAFRALRDAGLQNPTLRQEESSVTVILGHERLADAQSLVLDHLDNHSTINNATARELTGITDANRMKQIFLQLKDKGLLEMVPGTRSISTQWRRVTDSSTEDIDQMSLF